jgi:hypothetical protein
MSGKKEATNINYDQVIELDNNNYSEWVSSLDSHYEDEEPIEYPESKLISGQFDYLESIRNSTEELPF